MRTPYGYVRTDTNRIRIDIEQAKTIRLIYHLYLQNKSLGGIVDALAEQKILSFTGNPLWSRAAIDKILNNGRYVPSIISEKQFSKVQLEKEHITDINENGRKNIRYNSQNVLSGLLICSDCESNYRRITRISGEVVWRCADKVENGKKSRCTNVVTVSDEEIKRAICNELNLESFDEEIVEM